ncbi:hypothetical protein [Brevibacillus reuszeri]|uniref:hypothetical protein n=1 Tax=Brevibacillus reuszeri TaxID=54915 RepID=UPI001F28BA3D|nr:hypothetical protein [Brevibacillus reuszeri]
MKTALPIQKCLERGAKKEDARVLEGDLQKSKEMRAQMPSKARLLPEKMQKIMNRPQ